MFKPRRVIFEEKTLEYKLGKELYNKFSKNENIEIKISKNGRITGIPGKQHGDMYKEGKQTLVVGIRKSLEFQTCKPSAHYQLPLVSGCMGMCEYCYLNTQMGKKPYVKIHVNNSEILNKANEYINIRKPEITIFEGAATSDPIPVEIYSNALKDAIEFFGKNPYGKFRFVTKYTDVDSLLNLHHNNRTMIRFSLNTDDVIKKFEHRTPILEKRIEAALKVAKSGYKIGFIIAPVFLYENWESQYGNLIATIADKFKDIPLEFEVISHRFTKRAKENIQSIFPQTLLPMEEKFRKFKYGQFGYGKYIYNQEELDHMKYFFTDNIKKYFGENAINYII
ncbi:Spore photoproduct lyase [Clostridium novyi A str. 4552]|uniref:Spore photoproduct lyase n=1 Tax=Clostridium novyi A str. 4552 TaxID=1444289 RepID=A0A0A0IC27_CLONO|nr:spore photoproduct lyase [Clostridium novyi]KGM98088.1 Spore photoproduct lyase [Clostridium novyi A str. 4552]